MKLNFDQIMTCISKNMLVDSIDDVYKMLNDILGIEIYTHLIPCGLNISSSIVGSKIGFQKAIDLVENMEKNCSVEGGKIDMVKYADWKKVNSFEVEIDELSEEDKEKVKYQLQGAEKNLFGSRITI